MSFSSICCSCDGSCVMHPQLGLYRNSSWLGYQVNCCPSFFVVQVRYFSIWTLTPKESGITDRPCNYCNKRNFTCFLFSKHTCLQLLSWHNFWLWFSESCWHGIHMHECIMLWDITLFPQTREHVVPRQWQCFTISIHIKANNRIL